MREAIPSQDLRWRVQFLRSFKADDGYGAVDEWRDFGPVVRAARRDVSDGEKASSGTVFSELSTRFRVDSTKLTRSITTLDRLREGERVFQIIGIKELGYNDGLEITAVASQ